MKKAIPTFVLCAIFCASFAPAQTAVTLAPQPYLQFFTQSGQPLAFGCVFTYEIASTTPLSTYTDWTGNTLNANPVILSAGGTANIWLASGNAYSFKVMSAGGLNCASGTTVATVAGIGGGGSTNATTVITYSATPNFPVAAENQLFILTLTGNASAQPLTFVGITPPAEIFFQIIQDAVGGRTFSWPANSVGGCVIGSAPNQVTTVEMVYDGTNATAVGPCVTGNGPTSVVSQLTSTVSTGTPPLVVASQTEVTNFNANLLEGFDWASPGTIGSTAPNTGNFTTVEVGGSLPQTGVQGGGSGGDTKLLAAGTVSGTPGVVFCTDTNGGATTAGCAAAFNPPQRVVLAAPVSMTGNSQTLILTETVTFPSGPGTYRADVRYGLFLTVGPNTCVGEAIDTTNSKAFAVSGQDANGTGYIALSGAEISTNTYAAGATAIFTLQAVCNDDASPHLVGATVNSGLLTISPAEPTYLSVTPVLSN
jgi:hypothetical protein